MSNESPFSDKNIRDSFKKLENLEENKAEIGIVVEDSDIGIAGSISKDIGKPGGWEVGAEGSWMRRTGAKLAALLKWSVK